MPVPPRGLRAIFAEVSLHIDNTDRLAPAGFNDHDHLDIVRRITRDVGSAYKAAGKDVRARDVQMLFADASTGAHSPALVRQGQIAELINAKPKNRRRILEEAAGISGLYQRRHEAELKLNAAETNLARVDDVIEQLASQLAQLARQARQAARYREIGDQLRRSEGMLLYRRWREADDARAATDEDLRSRTTAAAQAEALVARALKVREAAEAALPPLREEEAIAAALLQRLLVQRDTLQEQEARAEQTVDTLTARITQLSRDIEREGGLNRDAGETIARLEGEATDLADASEGHDAALEAAATEAHDAATILQTREEDLAQQTEDVARLAARHGSAERLLEDSRKTQAKSEAEAERARAAVAQSREALDKATTDFDAAQQAETSASAAATAADDALIKAEEARAETQAREAEARANAPRLKARSTRCAPRSPPLPSWSNVTLPKVVRSLTVFRSNTALKKPWVLRWLMTSAPRRWRLTAPQAGPSCPPTAPTNHCPQALPRSPSMSRSRTSLPAECLRSGWSILMTVPRCKPPSNPVSASSRPRAIFGAGTATVPGLKTHPPLPRFACNSLTVWKSSSRHTNRPASAPKACVPRMKA